MVLVELCMCIIRPYVFLLLLYKTEHKKKSSLLQKDLILYLLPQIYKFFTDLHKKLLRKDIKGTVKLY